MAGRDLSEQRLDHAALVARLTASEIEHRAPVGPGAGIGLFAQNLAQFLLDAAPVHDQVHLAHLVAHHRSERRPLNRRLRLQWRGRRFDQRRLEAVAGLGGVRIVEVFLEVGARQRHPKQVGIVLNVVEIDLVLQLRRIGHELGEAEHRDPLGAVGQFGQRRDQFGIVRAHNHLPAAIRGRRPVQSIDAFADQIGATLSGHEAIAERDHEARRAQEVHESLLSGRPEDERGGVGRGAAGLLDERFQPPPVGPRIGTRRLADHAAERAVNRRPVDEHVVSARLGLGQVGIVVLQCHGCSLRGSLVGRDDYADGC